MSKLQNVLGINLLVRFKNPVFWVQLMLAVFLPVLTYFGKDFSQLTTWHAFFSLLGDAVANPVVVVTMLVAAWNAITDPTTCGLCDSKQALSYIEPKKE